MIGPKASLTVLAIAIGAMVSPAASGSVIRISNANNHEIPLRNGSIVQFDASGNLIAECQLNASNVCAELSNGSGENGTLPTISLARNDNNTEVTAGETIRLAWSSTDAAVCSGTASGPATTSWAGPKPSSNSTGQTLTLSTVGMYTFSLQCFNASGGSAIRDISVSVAEAQDSGGGTSACTITEHPLVAPPTLTRADKTWVNAWSAPNQTAIAVYPNSVSAPVPIGAQKGGYTVIPFVPTANLTVNISFDHAQHNSGYGYTARPAKDMFISISPCPGDLRPANNSSADPFERSKCRIFAGSGSLFYTTTTANVCQLTPGVQYYINVAAIDTRDGLQAGENSCGNNLSGCDVQATHLSQ
jgi:hypothetical protein